MKNGHERTKNGRGIRRSKNTGSTIFAPDWIIWKLFTLTTMISANYNYFHYIFIISKILNVEALRNTITKAQRALSVGNASIKACRRGVECVTNVSIRYISTKHGLQHHAHFCNIFESLYMVSAWIELSTTTNVFQLILYSHLGSDRV